MPPRLLIRLSVLLLIAVTILVDTVVLLRARHAWSPGPTISLAMTLMSSQLGLIGVWLGFGEPPLRVSRVMLTVAVVSIWVMLRHLAFHTNNEIVQLLMIALVAAVTVSVLVARALGWRLDAPAGDAGAAAAPEEFRFSLRQAFVWTTLCAGMALGIRWVTPGWDLRFDSHLTYDFFSFAILTLMAVWATLGATPVIRLPLVALAAVGLGMLMPWVMNDPDIATRRVTTWLLLHLLLTTASLIVFRMCGYRVTRQTMSANDER